MVSVFSRKPRQESPRPADAAAEDNARFTHAFEESGKGWFWEIDAEGALTYISGSAGSPGASGDLRGRRLKDLVDESWDERDAVGSERTLGFYLSRLLPFTDVTVKSAADPAILWSLTGRPVLSATGGVIGFRGFGSDLSEKARAEAELRKAARYDSLTGLPNRATILKVLEDSLRFTKWRPCALIIIDLDRFKEVNDTLGHQVGDDVLRQAAERIDQIFGKAGTVGRLGGDEFEVVVSGDVAVEALVDLSTRCITYLSMPYNSNGRVISIGASIGIASALPEIDGSESLFRKADLALYSAKKTRGACHIFQPEMELTATNRQNLEHDLRKALATGQLSVFFQPVVNGHSETVAGFEALVRWDHPEQGYVPPNVFVQLAEDSGLIAQLGEWVLKAACKEAAKWSEHLFVAVNVSPTQFSSKDFTRIVLQALAEAQLPAGRLELEVTEAVFLANNPEIDTTFAALKRIGVRLALDDFGTGYSSLAYLERAPFDKLKIDRTFVRGASLPGSRSLPILEAIVGLAHRLQMQTTAEGAETHQELELVRALECTYIQGFIFGRPMKPEDALAVATASAPVGAEGFTNSRAPRHRLIRKANLHVGGQTLQATIRNISPGGALIECPRELEPGFVGKLETGGFNLLEVEVVWSRDRKAGLRFISQFDLRGILSAAPGAA